jgi:ribosomal protein RSM22 (predicted rRNA methylase)
LYRKAPYHYNVFKRVLNEIKQRVPHLTAEKDGQKPLVSVLDYGAGLGSGLWAANDVFNSKKMAAVEPNMAMRKLGKFLSEHTDDNLENALWVDSLSMIP